MSQLLMNKLGKLAGGVALLVVFLVVGTVDASAQGVHSAAVENPYGLLAQKLGVIACQVGTATNVQGGVATLEAWTQSVKANLSTAPLIDKVKYEYYSKSVSAVRDFSVAPEIALLSELSIAMKKIGDQTITIPQLAGLYNGAKVSFGMCN